jgi:hypothetical protein
MAIQFASDSGGFAPWFGIRVRSLLSIARVDPLPHQLEAVDDYFIKLPRIRFLLAEDPGAGKTIMAGLLIKELKIRGLVKRTLNCDARQSVVSVAARTQR